MCEGGEDVGERYKTRVYAQFMLYREAVVEACVLRDYG